MKKETTLRCPYWASNSRPLAWKASVHPTVLCMHQITTVEYLAVLLDTAGSSALKHPFFQVQWLTATLIYLQRSFFVCSISFICSIHLYLQRSILFAAYFFYLQHTFFICSVLFYLQRFFFVCSVLFLFAAYFFYLQRSFFVCSVSFLFAAFRFCLQRVPCGPS